MKNLLQSLSDFHKDCPPIKKEQENPYYKSSYATLDAIQHHIKPYLNKHGLVITQVNIMVNEQPFVQTNIWHRESGETLLSTFPIIVQKNTPQEYGSAVSYAKRYSLSGLLNLIIADEDDDGNASSQPTKVEAPVDNNLPWLDEKSESFEKVKKAIQDGKATLADARKKFKISKKVSELLTK